ncbi:unnamed protein product [Periconia digitata]|uniref:Heterokaryon incompatibility domain-containing protein n=1 Tax=Periconia digitata TaxID=1303443 RepID=A0A9W4XIQ9_9PLEO|nr:unnamed protein product [Periconia digitata]
MPIPVLSSLSLSKISRRFVSSDETPISAQADKNEVLAPEQEEREKHVAQDTLKASKEKTSTQYPVPASPIVSDDVVTDAMLRRARVRVGTDPLRTNGVLYTNVTPEQRNLCDYCAVIDWRALLIRNAKPSEEASEPSQESSLTRLSTRRWEDSILGSWANVKLHKYTCTLCDLLYRGLIELYGSTPRDDVRTASDDSIILRIRCENPSTDPPQWPEKLLEHSEIFGKFRLKVRFEGIEIVRSFGSTSFDDLSFCVLNDVTRLEGDSYSELSIKKLAMPTTQQNQIEIELLRIWARECQLEHSLCRSGWGGLTRKRRQKTRSYTLRVIDCSNKKVVVAKGECRYATLSYVWGQTDQYTSRKQDILTTVDEEQIIDLSERTLAETVADAILVTKEMGIRYLWVDTVCIVQDDLEEKKETLSAMDEIYKQSVLTIVAATGTHANVGLAGIRPNSRVIDACQGWVDGLHLRRCNKYDAEPKIEETPWASRGWTYQESYFSPRKLIFANNRVYYHCSESSFGEVQPLKKGCFRRPIFQSHSSTAKELQTMRSTPTGPFTLYAEHVENYNWRTLSFQEDVLAAFAGVASDIERATDKRMRLFEGLPVGFLARALCWEVKNPQPRQTSARRLRSSDRRPIFPTWTWAAWNIAVHYTHQYYFNEEYDATGTPSRIELRWPWPEGAEYQLVEDHGNTAGDNCDSYIYDTLSTGILTCKAKIGLLEKSDPLSSMPHTMDDGTIWEQGIKQVMSVAEVFGRKSNFGGRDSPHQHFVLFLVEEEGIFFREGAAWMSDMDWKSIKAEEKAIRLG